MGKWPTTVWATLRTLRHTEPVEVDGRRRRVWMLFIGNGAYIAEGLAPARRHRLDDGLLDLRLVHAEKPWAHARVFLSMLTGRLARCAVYGRRMIREVQIRCMQGPVRLTTDGEVWDGSEDFTVRKREKALLLMKPQDPDLAR